MAHYNLAEYSEALGDFKEAYRTFEEPSLLFNIGQCFRALDQKRDAVRSYRAFLREAKDVDPDTRLNVERLITSLENAMREEQNRTTAPAERRRGSSESPAVDATVDQQPVVQPQLSLAPKAQATAGTERRPVYRQWWLWTTVAVAVAGVVVGGTLGALYARPNEHTFTSVSF